MSGTASGRSARTDRIESSIRGPLAEIGFDVEAVEVMAAGKRRVVRIAIDQDGGVTLDEVAEATREISQVLDDSDAMGEEPYTLEVTSRGVDRPLTDPRHWRRNLGRLVKVTLVEGGEVTGRIETHSEEPEGEITLAVNDKGRTSTRTVAYHDIAKALVQVEFNRKEAAALEELDDDEVADELNEEEDA